MSPSVERGEVDLDELRQVLRQAADADFVELVQDDHARGLAGRRSVLVEEVQRHVEADRVVLVDALEVQVQDLLLERMALHVTQQDLLGLAVDAQGQDRGVEPLVLAGEPERLCSSWMFSGVGLGAVDDGRDLAAATEAAARTFALVRAAGAVMLWVAMIVVAFCCDAP